MTKINSRSQAWIIWLVAAIFYAYEFFLRISPKVMLPELAQAFNVHAQQIADLSAAYYFAYACMQIPAGVLFDRYGIQKLLIFAAIIVTSGSLLFAFTIHLPLADLGRILMGIGSAFSFIGCLKLASNWFSTKQLALVIGLTNMLGVIGALCAETPLAYSLALFGWRHTMLITGLFGLVLAIFIRLLIRDEPSEMGYSPLHTKPKIVPTLLKGIGIVIKSRQTWLNALYGSLMVAPISAFAELWDITFFMQADHFTRFKSASLSMMIFIGIAVGGPTLGWLSDKIGRRKPIMWLGNLGALLCLVCIIWLPIHSLALLIILLFGFGFFTSNMLLIFAINTENHPNWAAGAVIGFTNMIVIIGGTIFQPLMGALIDFFHISITNPQAHGNSITLRYILLLLPLCQLLAGLLLVFIRETYCHCPDSTELAGT